MNVDIFARVLHAIFLGATYLPPDQFELNLDYHVFERLSNPALIDYDNPSNMFFMKSAANIYKNYWKELDDLPAYDRLARNIKKSSKYKKETEQMIEKLKQKKYGELEEYGLTEEVINDGTTVELLEYEMSHPRYDR